MLSNTLTPDILYAYIDSPIGRLTVVATEQGLTEIRFPNQIMSAPSSLVPTKNLSTKDLSTENQSTENQSTENQSTKNRTNQLLEQAVTQLQEYFDGQRKTFDLILAPSGTDFQKKVWAQLRKIPYGSTASYGAIAAAIGKPTAARAVGMANSKNPLPIVVPCHRVIGSNGALTGFAGGLDTKRWLLARELPAD